MNSIPVSKAPYKREYHHTKGRGRETKVTCGFCGKQVPRYKSFTTYRGFRITDPTLLKSIDRRHVHMFSRKMYVCPSCARFRKIVKPGRSARKKRGRR